MNFFHLSVGHISRSTGRSTVQNVAYITGEVLYEERRELKANYANNRGMVTWGTIAPLGSGIAEDDLSFWDKLENFEDAYAKKRFKNPDVLEKYLGHARTAQTYVLALPKELTPEQNIALVTEAALERFVSRGLLATWTIHWEEGNPHAHITVSTRTVWNGEISWDKSVARALVTPSGLRETRKRFGECVNKHQELAGLSDRVDWRSYVDQGIDLIPGYHKGWQAHQMEKEGLFSPIVAENAQILEENKERIAQFPEIILKELTSKQATFSERDVVKLVQSRMKDDIGVVSQHIIYAVMKEAVEVGVGFDDIKRYTSKEYKAKEDYILESLEALGEQKAAGCRPSAGCRSSTGGRASAGGQPLAGGRPSTVSISQDRVDELLGGEASWLNAGQKEAVKTLCGDSRFSVLVGRAGTGKTTALQYVVRLHQEAGYTVLGMAPSATAAHELRKGAGCASDTIAHYAYHWKPYFEGLDKLEQATTEEEREACREAIEAFKVSKASQKLPNENTLILVDEIGMVGVGDAQGNTLGNGLRSSTGAIAGGWHPLIKIVQATGAKLMVVGDDHQAKPVEAGDVSRKVFRDFRDKGNLCVLTEIQRQKIPWMKEASLHLAELRTSEALGMYETQGHIQSYETDADVYRDMARQYLRTLVSQPDSETLAMAYTNDEVRELNGAIRKILKDNKLLEREDILTRKRRIENDFDDQDPAHKGAENLLGESRENQGQKEQVKKCKTGETVQATQKEAYAEEGYTVGDKIVFTQNDRGFWTKFDSADPTFFVRNGMEGRIESITPCRIKDRDTGKLCGTYKISVRVEEVSETQVSAIQALGTEAPTARPSTTRVSGTHVSMVSFYLREYSHFQHGYAVTIHKTQGATGDGSLLKVSRYMDPYLTYVAFTRHRQDISIYYSKEDFADFPSLLKNLGKLPTKDLAADYSILEEHREFWLTVQEYKALGFELLSVRAFAKCARSGNKTDKAEQAETERAWTTVRKLEEERKGLARIILDDWDVCGDFARQAGMTRETLQIAAGLKKRSLSRLEEQVQLVVGQYASVAIETRQFWQTIRKTHPGMRAKTHPEWATFEALRDQRGFLANRIIQDPVLYRPFLREAGKAFEEEGSNIQFGYGMPIIKAQAEAWQSKLLQQGLLDATSDPQTAEKLQTLLDYVEARDLSASLWKALKPKLAHFKGTLLSEGFCKEIDEWKDMRMERDQRALKIVDFWEDYNLLIQKVGLKLSFETLVDQKDQAVRDTLLKTYTTSQEETAKLHAAFDLKTLMEEDRAAGKKATISDVYFYGVQPKNIARHALEYQKLKVFEGLKTEHERQLFLLLDEYDDKCREANRAYVVCLNEVEEMNGNAYGDSNEDSNGETSEEGKEFKPWDAPSWPVYQKACKPRNRLALEIFDRSNHGEVMSLADLMGLNLREVELEQIFIRGERAFRDIHIETYLTSLDQGEKGESACALIRLINSEREQSKRGRFGHGDDQGSQGDNKGESITAKQVYHAGIDFKELQQAANAYRQSRVLETLATEEEVKTFHALQAYEKATHLANQAYKNCIEEAQAKSLKAAETRVGNTSVTDTRVWQTEAFKTYTLLAAAQNRIARTLFEEHNIEFAFELSRKMGMSLDVCKFITQVENGMRDFYLDTFKETESGLVKAVSAAEVYGLLEADERQGSKKTFGALKSKGIPASDIRDYTHQFNRLDLMGSLNTEAEKEQFRLYSAYDYYATVAKGIYRRCIQDQDRLGIKASESDHFPAYREAAFDRNVAALALSKRPDFLGCLDLAEQKGLSVNREIILCHAEDGYRAKALIRYKELEQSPDTASEIVKAELASHLVKITQDDQGEGHKKTLLAIYQAGLKPKDVFAAANELKEFTVFKTLETEEERHIFGLVIKYRARSEKANGLYRQCVQESTVGPRREKLTIKVSDNPLYPDYLAAVSARNESATALLGCTDWEGCLLLGEQLGIEIDESKVIAQSQDGRREMLLGQYTRTDSILVKRLIARELKEMMDEDQKEEKKVTVADLYRNNILPRDIQDEARQFDRMATYASLTNDEERRIFSFLAQYDDLIIQSNRHYSASFQEAEEQGIKKEQTASYALFHEVLTERQKIAVSIHHMAKPHLVEAMAEDMGVSLKTLAKDRRHYEIKQGQKEMAEEIEEKNHEEQAQFQSQSQDQETKSSFTETGKAEEKEKSIPPVSQDTPSPSLDQGVICEQIDLAAKRFVSLSEKYEQTHWKDPERDKIRESLDKIISAHWQKDQFVSKIENSGSKIAADSIKIEIHLLETELSHSRRQFGQPPEEGGTGHIEVPPASFSKAVLRKAEEIELAAKEFVSLSERYEKAHWKDPERETIRKSLDGIVSTYWQNDQFVSKIENSGSKTAVNSIKVEIHLMETELSQSRRELDR
jgi:ATP-dependent exoDNAse (exonuclease V) alpha subunit